MRKGLTGVVQSGCSSARTTVPKAKSRMKARSRRGMFCSYHVARRMAVWIDGGKLKSIVLQNTGVLRLRLRMTGLEFSARLLECSVDVADEVADVAATVEERDHRLLGGFTCGRVVGVFGSVPL